MWHERRLSERVGARKGFTVIGMVNQISIAFYLYEWDLNCLLTMVLRSNQFWNNNSESFQCMTFWQSWIQSSLDQESDWAVTNWLIFYFQDHYSFAFVVCLESSFCSSTQIALRFEGFHWCKEILVPKTSMHIFIYLTSLMWILCIQCGE